MTGNKGVVVALVGLGEARQTAVLPQRGKRLFSPGDDLVRVALVADVKDDPVSGAVVDPMDGEGELDRSEIRRQMAARPGDAVDLEGAQLVTQRVKLFGIQFFYVGRCMDVF